MSHRTFSHILCAAEDITSSRTGRIRGVNVPQEYELANFIKDVGNTDPSWNTNTPACEWYHVICDEGNKVSRLDWGRIYVLRGRICLKYLPHSVLEIHAKHNKLTGELPLKDLPPAITIIDLSYNNFTGSIDLTCLPQTLRQLVLRRNKLSGNVDLGRLPLNLEFLAMNDNAFTGTPDLRRLPPNLSYLDLNRNQLAGWVEFDSLPSGLLGLCLLGNKELQGEVKNSVLPQSLNPFFVEIQDTKITYINDVEFC